MCALLELDGEFCEEALEAGIGMGVLATNSAGSIMTTTRRKYKKKGADTPANMRPLTKD